MPLGLLLLGALAFLPVLNWKRTKAQALRSVYEALAIASVLGVLVWFVLDPATMVVVAAVGLALWVVITHVRQLVFRALRGSLPAAFIGMTLAHLGFAMGTVGIAVTATQSVESDVRMAPQSQVELAGQLVTFTGVTEVVGPNYEAQQGIFILTDADGRNAYELRPEKRRYFAGGNVMTEAGIDPGFFSDTYLSLGEPLEGGAWAVRLHYKPLVRWIWLGALLMAMGGVVAAFDKTLCKTAAAHSGNARYPKSTGISGDAMSRMSLYIPLGVFAAILGLGYIGFDLGARNELPSALINKPFPEFQARLLESLKQRLAARICSED